MFKEVIFNIKKFFSRLKFRYKLTVYFTLFGILVGYLSFVFYTTIATNNLKNITAAIVDDWLMKSDLPADIIETYIGKRYSDRMNGLLPFINVFERELSSDPLNRNFDVFYYSPAVGSWYRLAKNHSGYIFKSAVIPEEEAALSDALKKGTLSASHSHYYGKSDSFYFWINLTRPRDRNIYIARIVSDRQSILAFIGGKDMAVLYTFSLFLFSLLLSKLIARHISGPISRLSTQAAGIASGNLDLRTEIVSRDEIGDLSVSINIMAARIKENMESMKSRMDAISVMNRIDKAVLSSISRHDLIDRVTYIVSDLFKDCMVSLAIADNDRSMYVILSHYIKGVKGGRDRDLTLSFERLGAENVGKNRNFFVIEKGSDEQYLDQLNNMINENFKHIMNLPIYLDEEYIGSLIVGKDADTPFTGFEEQTLKALADQTGVAMKSVRFFEEKEKLFLGVLTALSKTIDAKSQWTSGHSQRVAEYSGKLAMMMGMNEAFLNDLRVSANLHDIGKIGVPESILDKTGALSEAEFEIIKKHPQDGASIIEVVPGYERFINGILFHHESWDGKGYPLGLEGRAIPLMGRLIAVADVFDSLISDRPYRNGMNREEAFAIMKSEKGKKLDPDIVEMMIKLVEAEEDGSKS